MIDSISAYLGSKNLLVEHPELAELSEDAEQPNVCRKDTGEVTKIRKWSRGYQFIISGGGHIEAFVPLYV